MFSLAPMLAIGLSLVAGGDTTHRWTVAEYLALVEATNPELTVARERVATAEARVGSGGRPPDPMVELGIMNRSLPRFGRSSPVAMDQIRISQSIPVPRLLGATSAAARGRVAVEVSWVAEVRRRLRWRATAELIELNRIDRATRLLSDFAATVRTLESVTQARYAVGEAEQPDVIRAQLEVARLTEELVTLRADRRAAVARLNAMALRPLDAPIDSIVLPPPPDSIPAIDVLVDRSMRGRPLLAVQRAARQAAGLDRRRAELDRWPELELGLAYGQQPMFGGSGTDRMVSVTIGTNLPLWSRGRQRWARREAEATERTTAAEEEVAQTETRARVGELAANVERASTLAQLYRGTLQPQTQIAAASALASYRIGKVDFETVASGHLAAIRAQLEVVRLEAERALAVAELEYLTALPAPISTEGGSQ